MSQDVAVSSAQRWALFRFGVIGGLLASPPAASQLRESLTELASKRWTHPITGERLQLGFTTIERWYYRARKAKNPVETLRSKERSDRGQSKRVSGELATVVAVQYRNHRRWTYQLHFDNLAALVRSRPSLGPLPSYTTIRRHMRAHNLIKQPRRSPRKEKEERREMRSFEVPYVGGLWHLDFHHGSRRVLLSDGTWITPKLLCILDDHSRLVCHAQWYLAETAENLSHALLQAFQKCDLPRAIQCDNGAAMKSHEVVQGLPRLGIELHFIEPENPPQNGKQECWWNPVEQRLLAMLEEVEELDLGFLNDVTQAWITYEYNVRIHGETQRTPVDRFSHGPSVLMPCPELQVLREALGRQVTRRQRRSDGTITIERIRFQLPSRYRHLTSVTVRYAEWNLSAAYLVDPRNDAVVSRLTPLDRTANADGKRRPLEAIQKTTAAPRRPEPLKLPPLLSELLAKQRQSGLPPAYLHQIEDVPPAGSDEEGSR